MENENKVHFKEIEERIRTQLNEIKNISITFPKVVFTGLSILIGIITFILLGIGIWSAFSIQNEIDTLKDLRTDISNDLNKEIEKINIQLGLLKEEPLIKLYSEIGKNLEGQTIFGNIERKGKDAFLRFSFILKNNGNSQTGPIYLQLYWKKPLDPTDKVDTDRYSPDEPDFDFYSIVTPENLKPSIIPADMSVVVTLRSRIKNERPEIKSIKHPVLCKVFFGTAEPYVGRFYIKLI